MGLGTAILLGCTLWILIKLWSHSRGKRERQQRTAKNPSQLSTADQNREVEENLAAIEQLRDESELDDEFREELEPMLDRFVEKPASEIFELTRAKLGVVASRILHVGDSPLEDYAGSVRAGLQAVLIDRHGVFAQESYQRIECVREVLEIVG